MWAVLYCIANPDLTRHLSHFIKPASSNWDFPFTLCHMFNNMFPSCPNLAGAEPLHKALRGHEVLMTSFPLDSNSQTSLSPLLSTQFYYKYIIEKHTTVVI